MTIQVGDKIPSVKLKTLTKDGFVDVDTDEVFANRKVVVFFVPGAFTPTCSKEHLPGYVEKADAIKAKGVDEIVCIAVNDPFVMNAWGKEHGARGKVRMLPDWNAELTRALGVDVQIDAIGLGTRSKRLSMIVEDGVVKKLDIEPGRGIDVSGAQHCLEAL